MQENQKADDRYVKSIVLKPIEEGNGVGMLAYHITFTGVTPQTKEERATATADICMRIINAGHKTKFVSFGGEYPDSSWMITLVQSLREDKFIIRAVIDGSTWYYWLGTSPEKEGRLVSWITVDLHDLTWKGFNANEVIYHLTSVADPEPNMPASVPFLYLSPHESLPAKDVMKFIKGSRQQWHLSVKNPAVKKFEVVL